tara:strand:+ start:9914 stop:10591 length:678 start_codon:yes stop_codon:yes gene_type:complete
MPIRKLITNGCSFMTHRPKSDVFTSTAHLFEDRLGVPALHLAQGGRGNLRLVATTKLHFLVHPNDMDKSIFCVIEWSEITRKDYVATSKWKSLKDQDIGFRTYHTTDNEKFLGKQLDYDIDETEKLNFVLQILDLQNFLQTNGIPYVMFNGMSNNTESKSASIKQLNDKVDKTRFFSFNKLNHFDYVRENNLAISDQDYHPTAEGHKVWFEMLYEFVQQNKCMEL